MNPLATPTRALMPSVGQPMRSSTYSFSKRCRSCFSWFDVEAARFLFLNKTTDDARTVLQQSLAVPAAPSRLLHSIKLCLISSTSIVQACAWHFQFFFLKKKKKVISVFKASVSSSRHEYSIKRRETNTCCKRVASWVVSVKRNMGFFFSPQRLHSFE